MSESLQSALARVAIFRTSSDAFVSFGKQDMNILTINPAAESMFGHHGTDLFGRPIGMLFSPQGVAADEAFPAHLLDGSAQETMACRADGSMFPAEVVINDANLGNESFFIACVRDISERKRAEESLRDSEAGFRAAVEALGEGVIITDEQDVVAYVNSRVAHLTGYNPEELLGNKVEDVLVPTGRAEEHRSRRELLLQGISEEYETRIRRKDGTEFWAEVNSTPYRDPQGEMLGTLSAFTDVTERQGIQEQLVAAIDASEDANRAKSAFLANMSHELRTPMNAILGYCELVQEDVQGRGLDELLPDLDKIHGAGKHLLRLINDILDLSKIEAKKIDLQVETFQVRQLVGDVADTMQHLIGKNGNTLKIEMDDALGSMKADLTRVRQVLMNLVGNAAKFTKDGTLRIAGHSSKEGGVEFVVFEVSDSGIGIAPEQLERLFQPFTQVDSSSTRQYEGTGLGLSISRQLCRLMGGDIRVESEVGKGSKFSVRLPTNVRAKGTSVSVPVTTIKATLAPGTKIPLVLVIDDDKGVIDLLGRFLAKQGMRVASARSGSEGLDAARKLRPSLITLDIVMPGMDGWAVLREIQKDEVLRQIPVFVISIVDNPSLGVSLGASAYMTKPIDWQRLQELLGRHLELTAVSK